MRGGFFKLERCPSFQHRPVVQLKSIGHFRRKQIIGRFVDDLLASDVKQIFKLPVDQKVTPLGVLEIDNRRGVIKNGLQPRLAQPVLFLLALAVGNISPHADQSNDPAPRIAQRRLGGQEPAASAGGIDHRFFPIDQWLPGIENSPFVRTIPLGQFCRIEVKIRLSHEAFTPGRSHDPGDSLVAEDKATLSVLDITRIRQAVDQSAQQVVFFDERLLGSLANNELANLRADGRHHPQQIFVRRQDLAAEELNNTEDLIVELDRKTKGCVQPLLGRNRCSRKVGILHRVDNPGWFASCPDPAGKT